MRCRLCNEILSTAEAVFKSRQGGYEDTCFPCLGIETRAARPNRYAVERDDQSVADDVVQEVDEREAQ